MEMPPAERLIDLCLGPARSQCIYLFTRLGLAELLAPGPCDHKILADSADIPHEPLYRLLRALASIEIVYESAPGTFSLSPLGRPLIAGASDSVRSHVLHMNEEMYFAWGHASHSLQTGRSAFGYVHGQEYFDWLAAHPEKAETAHRAMNDTQRAVNIAVAAAFDFSRTKSVCDVGGGHGALLSTILAHHPHLRGILFDLQSGCDVARSGIGGPLPRCEFITGDFFNQVPSGADIYLLKLVLHDWDDEAAEKILAVIRQAMHGEARLLIVESLRPAWPATSIADLWDFHMLVNTGGRERSLAEIERLADNAGLITVSHQYLDRQFSLVVLSAEGGI